MATPPASTVAEGQIGSEQPSNAPSSASQSSRPATPSLGSRLKNKLAAPFRKQRPKTQGQPTENTSSDPKISPDSNRETAPSVTIPPTRMLLSQVPDFKPEEETGNPARKVDMYEKAIMIIDIFQQGVKVTETALPNPVSVILENLVRVLGVLRQMAENKEAWKGLLLTFIEHQKKFNAQILRLKQEATEPDPDSPLLAPLRCYSETLKKLTARVMTDCGLAPGTAVETPAWNRVKMFVTRYMEAGSEQVKIRQYQEELVAAMRDLMQDLTTYTAFAVQDIGMKLDKMNESLAGHPAAKRPIKVTAKKAPAVMQFHVRREIESKIMVRHLIDSDTPGRKIFPITGMGGCGKTQLASYFLKENKASFTHVVYVDASSPATIQADLQKWAQSLGESHEQDEWNDALRFLSDGPPDGRWAYILDNADDPTLDLVPFLPTSDYGTIIITSRNRDVGDLATAYHLELGEMSKAEALSTLVRAARRQLPIPTDELASAHTLIDELGCLAVALVHAGAYCHRLSSTVQGVQNIFTFNQYLKIFHSKRADLMKQKGPSTLDGYTRGVYTTLDLSYLELSAPSREFFHFASQFHFSDIPVAMLKAAAEERFCDPHTYLPRPEGHENLVSRLSALLCTDGSWSDFQLQETIQALFSFSLVSTTFIDDALFLRFHPLVQAWARDMPSSDAHDYRTMAMQVLTSCCAEENVGIYRYLQTHILEILSGDSRPSMHVNDQIAIGLMLRDVGHYSDAEGILGEALNTLRQDSGDDSNDTLTVALELADVYYHNGRQKETEKLELEVMEKRTRMFGAEHPGTIQAAANLAATYFRQGRWNEAETLQLKILEKFTRIFGAEHPDTIVATAELACTYASQGRLNEAEKLQLEVLEKRTMIFGAQHPQTTTAAASLASTYYGQRRWNEAEKLHLEVLEKRTRYFGAEHPDTIIATANLASTYAGQGRLNEAEKLQLEVLEKRTRIFGAGYTDTIGAAAELANAYYGQGRLNEAEKLQLEVLEKQTRILGAEHPYTITAAANLARTYCGQGRWNEAEKLQMGVLERQRRILGSLHPHTITAADNLANTYYDQGRWNEAEKLQLEVLEKRARISGADHRRTITAAANLAATYREQRRWNEAEKLELEVLEKQTRILGAEHPYTMAAAANLAHTYYGQGRWTAAEKLQMEVLETWTRLLGAKHPQTVTAAASLAVIYRAQGKDNEARELDGHRAAS